MINPKIQDELRERFNPDGSLLRNHQIRLLEMLKYFDGLCKVHGITYWLSSGTLIGAVRHGGFIPWDDDVDVEMLKDDYEKLVRVFESDPNPKFILQTHKSDYYYFAPFAKLRDRNSVIKEMNTDVDLYYKYRGVFIDIFIMEPSSSRLIARGASGLHNLLLLHPMSYIKNSIIRPIYYCIVFFLLYKIVIPILRMITRIGAKDRLRLTVGSSFIKERYRGEIFPVQKILFENIYVPIPNKFDSYLHRIYGNYMKLPKIESIETHTAELILK